MLLRGGRGGILARQQERGLCKGVTGKTQACAWEGLRGPQLGESQERQGPESRRGLGWKGGTRAHRGHASHSKMLSLHSGADGSHRGF